MSKLQGKRGLRSANYLFVIWLAGCGLAGTSDDRNLEPIAPSQFSEQIETELSAAAECETSVSSQDITDLELQFWDRWCAYSVSERLEEFGVRLSTGESWRSFAVTVGVNACNDISALISSGSTPYEAALEIEEKLARALFGESDDLDRYVSVKSTAIAAVSAAVDILCPENSVVPTDDELSLGSGQDCTVSGLTLFSECSGVDLTGEDLSGRDLSFVDFSGAKLDFVNFSGSDLSGANLSGASARSAVFERVRWWNGSARDADFDAATFYGAYLGESDFVGANFNRANIIGTNFDSSDLRNTTFREVSGFARENGEILKAYFGTAHLGGSDLTGAYLPGVNFSGAQLNDAVMSFADLREAWFECADLSNVTANGANFFNATYNGSTVNASFEGMVRSVNNEYCSARPSFGDVTQSSPDRDGSRDSEVDGNLAPRDLWIDDVPMSQPSCDGSFIAIVFGASRNGIIGGLSKFRGSTTQSAIEAKYLKTDVTCASLNPSFSSGALQGQSIYVVYYGPFANRYDAQQQCLDLGLKSKSECYVAPLTNSESDRSVRYGPNSK